jgi:hypothetical protein
MVANTQLSVLFFIGVLGKIQNEALPRGDCILAVTAARFGARHERASLADARDDRGGCGGVI